MDASVEPAESDMGNRRPLVPNGQSLCSRWTPEGPPGGNGGEFGSVDLGHDRVAWSGSPAQHGCDLVMRIARRTTQPKDWEDPVVDSRRKHFVGTKASGGRSFSTRVRVPLSLVVVGALLLGLLSVTAHPVVQLDPGHNIELLSGGGDSGYIAPYSAGEFWGGGSEVENCSVCSPSGLIAEAGGQSTKPDQNVDPMMEDYTQDESLFSVGAIGADLSMDLTYDSGQAAAEHSGLSGAPSVGAFGYGWNSVVSSSVVVSGATATLNDDNGAQTTFAQPTANSCPEGDYPDWQKYTIPGSAYAYCAAYRVDAQLGFFSATDTYQVDKDGGAAIQVYDSSYGTWEMDWEGTNQTLSSDGIIIESNETAGSTNTGGEPCPDSASKCFVETDEADTNRHVVAAENGFGLVTAVWDPMEREYQMSYTDGGSNLNSIEGPSPTGTGDATTSFTYSTTAASPYKSDLTEITDPDSNTTHINYYSYGMVHDIVDPYGNTTSYIYNDTDCANLAETDCSQGAQEAAVSFSDGEYDSDTYGNGLLWSTTFGAYSGLTTSWSFIYTEPTSDPEGPTIETVEPPSGANATIETDAVGNVISFTDLAGNTTTSMYNDTGGNDLDELCWSAAPGVSVPSNASCTNPPTGSTNYTYDAYGNQLSETDPLGNTTRNGYYENGLLCWTAPPTITAAGSSCANDGSSPTGAPAGATTYTYDTQGDVVSTTVPASPSPSKTTTSEYNLDDQLSYSIPPDGQGAGSFGSNLYETTDIYEPDGSLASTTGPLGRTVSYSYDLAGNVLTSADPAGVTSNAYDQDNRLCWSYRAGTAYGSNACSSPPSSGATKYYPYGYDGDTDAPVGVTDPDGQATTYVYADDRYPTSATTTTEAAVSTNPQPNIITYTSYNQFGNVCMSGPVSPGTVGTCNAVTGDTYDEYYNGEGQLEESKDANGNATTYNAYDDAFPLNPTSVTSPTGTTTYGYDADGNLITTMDPESQTVTTGYDADSRPCFVAPTVTSASCGTPPTGVAGITLYGYDEAGQRTSMTDNYGASGQITDNYSYDANGNLLSATNDNSETTTYSYDDANDVTCTSYPTIGSSNCTPGSRSGAYVTRAYNSGGELSSTTDWLGNTVSYTNYNPLSEVETITYPSATGETLGYTYDADGNVTNIAYSGSAISALNGVSDTYTPDANNQVEASTSLGGYSSPENTYNAYGRLQGASNPGSSTNTNYAYNDDGEITSTTPPGESAITDSYNSAEELSSTTNPNNPSATEYNSYGYTGDGQRCLSVTGSSTYSSPGCATAPSGSTVLGAYNYNAYGQLCWSGTTASNSGCSSPPAGATTYSYDGNNLRLKATTGSSTSTFDWDTVNGGPTPLDLSDGTNSYIYGPLLFGGTAPIEQISSTGVSFLASTPSGVQAVFGSPTWTSATSSADKFTYGSSGGSTPGTISAVSGTLAQSDGTGNTTLAVTPEHVGDALVLSVMAQDPTVSVTSVSGGGATWQPITSTSYGYEIEMWLGTVTTTGSSTITVTFSSSVASTGVELDSQEYASSTGASTTWGIDKTGYLKNTASSSTLTYPTLSPTGTGELYVGFANAPEWADTGSTSGFTYVTSDWGDQLIYDPSVSASVSPTGTQYASSFSGTIGALLTATGTGGGGGSCPTGSASGSGPIVTGVSPCTGSTSGGTSVTITGSNFTGVTGVKFGTTPASSYSVTSSTSITAVSPAGSTGPVDVTVTTGGMRLEELAAYSAYGMQTIQSGTDVTPFGFQGSYTDPSGLIYLIDRYYDPSTDQFLSVDPDVAETGQPYAFTGDDPLNETDPLGKMVTGPQGAVGAYSIYVLFRNGVPYYVGMTKQALTKRLYQHERNERYDRDDPDYTSKEIASSLDKETAEAGENYGAQYLGTVDKSDPEMNQQNPVSDERWNESTDLKEIGTNLFDTDPDFRDSLGEAYNAIPSGSAQYERASENWEMKLMPVDAEGEHPAGTNVQCIDPDSDC
jgi:RHS repeat-associated protein